MYVYLRARSCDAMLVHRSFIVRGTDGGIGLTRSPTNYINAIYIRDALDKEDEPAGKS